MQLIPATFARYHVAGTSGNIFDPVANIAAALQYIKARYGSIFRIDPPRGGYKMGGPVGGMPAMGWYGKGGVFTKPSIIGVGERGPEAVVPLNRGFGSGDVNFNFDFSHANIANPAETEAAIERGVNRGLAKYAAANSVKRRRGGRAA